MHITNKISQYFHIFATKEFPRVIQNIVNKSYVKLLGLDMSDFQDPSTYKTLNALFTRALVTPRHIDNSLDTFISPADSLVSAQGKIRKNTALQVKGMQYNVDNLFTSNISDENKKRIHDGDFMNFYLSPKDYHRYHSVFSCNITKLIHVPGKLYPVNFKYLNKQESLFVENERVILECVTAEDKLFYMVFIGALNVGKMIFEFENRVNTNIDKQSISVYEYDDLKIKKGDCLGYFEMGSTVLLFWEEAMVDLESLSMQDVKFTQTIAKIK